MISSGGDFRPDDEITRAEMAHFLVGLLAAAAPNVTIDSSGVIQLGTGGTAEPADDYFADARSSLPRARDAEISAIYELGVTTGASAAAVQDDTEPPLDYNYEPAGTVNRGEMAAFITRALAHTSVRPEGISAQYDGTSVVVSARDENFAPRENVTVDVFTIDAGGADLAFRADGSCAEVTPLSGTFRCEIDAADSVTGGDGDALVPLEDGVADGGSAVWAWTGDNEDTVDDDTDLFRLDIAESEEESMADRVRISTEFAGAKAHLGSSVLYTVQLQDGRGDVTVGTDGKKPASFLVTLTTTALVPDPADTDTTDGIDTIDNPQGASVVSTLPLTTDADGAATFSVSGLPDQAKSVKTDKYRVDIVIQPRTDGNAPAVTNGAESPYYIGDATTESTASATGLITVGAVIFSTEDASRAADDVTVSVKPAAGFVAASARGASNRATVSVTDQYGDPVPNVWCTLASTGAGTITIGGARNVGSDGAYTFGYERVGDTAATETLTASCDQDGDGDGDTATPQDTGTASVEWAAAPGETGTGADIRAVDTETNTIFVGADGAVAVLTYDSNDRYNIDADGSGPGTVMASTYAGFEKSISDADTLTWAIAGMGSRAVNSFTLIKADS